MIVHVRGPSPGEAEDPDVKVSLDYPVSKNPKGKKKGMHSKPMEIALLANTNLSPSNKSPALLVWAVVASLILSSGISLC